MEDHPLHEAASIMVPITREIQLSLDPIRREYMLQAGPEKLMHLV